MSRIRGIEARLPKDHQSRNGRSEVPMKIVERTKPRDDDEKEQIRELLHKLPKLDDIFEVHKKIGEGTFSSVYLGSLRKHARLTNSEKKWFAIKHLVPTAHPARIEHELRCLQDMGGRNHVIGIELCLRHYDTIVFVMPYIPHRKFSEYIVDMDAAELQQYMRALMTALQHVHSFGVIHRDVKPSNFLYDRENRRYLLVDFGLAQRICPAPEDQGSEAAPPPPPPPSSGARKRVRDEEEPGPEAKRIARDGRAPPAPPRLAVHVLREEAGAGADAGAEAGAGAGCACAGVGAVCGECARRPGARAPRAGTQGFRPPEVLLKVRAQSCAVDAWAAGVVLLSALAGRYPLLRASDDAAALAELAALLGTAALQRAARRMGRRIVASSVRRPLSFKKLCKYLRSPPDGEGGGEGEPCPGCHRPGVRCLCLDSDDDDEESGACGWPGAAFSLARALLQPLPAARATAAAALRHRFLAQPLQPPQPPQPRD